jgi:hypothetical protein
MRTISKFEFGRYVIGFQGFYYLLTGLWALISIESFNYIVGHAHDNSFFETHLLAAMSVVLGLFFIYSVREKNWYKKNFDTIYLVIGIALAIIIVELIYLPSMSWNLFWIDFIEEFLIIILLMFVIKNGRKA